jgi:hypothetical protein
MRRSKPDVYPVDWTLSKLCVPDAALFTHLFFHQVHEPHVEAIVQITCKSSLSPASFYIPSYMER